MANYLASNVWLWALTCFRLGNARCKANTSKPINPPSKQERKKHNKQVLFFMGICILHNYLLRHRLSYLRPQVHQAALRCTVTPTPGFAKFASWHWEVVLGDVLQTVLFQSKWSEFYSVETFGHVKMVYTIFSNFGGYKEKSLKPPSIIQWLFCG